MVLQAQRFLEEVREQHEIFTLGGSSRRGSEHGSRVSRESGVSTASQKARTLRGNLAAQRAKEKFTVQADKLELEAAKADMERKQLQIRLNRLREGGEKAGMEAELSVLEEGEAVGDRSLLDTDNPYVDESTLTPLVPPHLSCRVYLGQTF